MKAAKIVAHVRSSTTATDLLQGDDRLQAANATRWNSQLTMIKSILKIPADKLNQLSTTHKLNTHERILLTELVEILAPFEEATKYVQFEKKRVCQLHCALY